MIYPYLCDNCANKFEVIKSVKAIDDHETCPTCKCSATRTIAVNQMFHGANDWNTAHYNHALGMHVRSNKEAQRIARERGMIEIGNESVEKIHKSFDSDREKRLAYDI